MKEIKIDNPEYVIECAREWLIEIMPDERDLIESAPYQKVFDVTDRYFDGGLTAFVETCR